MIVKNVDYSIYRRISRSILMLFVVLTMLPKVLIQWLDISVVHYIILPVSWILFLFVFFRFIPRVHPIGRLAKLENLYAEAMVSAIALTAIQFFAGSFIGQLGESPYDLSPAGIMKNLLFVVPPLVGREYVRSYVLCTYCLKPNIKAFFLITVLMTVFELNYSSFTPSLNLETLTIYFAKEVGPVLCKNILLSYFGLYGGAVSALLFLGIVTLFHWSSPILPVLNWLSEGVIGIAVPIFALSIIVRKYEIETNNIRHQELKKSEVIKWSLTGAFSIGLIWFVVGVFPIMPSVIATGSMEPMIDPGDIVLLKQIRSADQIRNLKDGDIIQFQRDEIRITHRIIDVKEDKLGNLSFQTKGDNNSSADSQIVLPNDVRGIFVAVVPKLGYPTLILKGHSQVDPSEVEF